MKSSRKNDLEIQYKKRKGNSSAKMTCCLTTSITSKEREWQSWHMIIDTHSEVVFWGWQITVRWANTPKATKSICWWLDIDFILELNYFWDETLIVRVSKFPRWAHSLKTSSKIMTPEGVETGFIRYLTCSSWRRVTHATFKLLQSTETTSFETL